MAVKTFSVGEVLTASDTNTYLANAGLQVVTPSSVTNGTLSGAKVTVGNAVSSVTVSGVFSSTYDNYRIVVSNVDFSNDAANAYLKISGSTGSTYSSAYYYHNYSTGTFSTDAYTSGGSLGFRMGLTAITDNFYWVCDLFGPNLAKATGYTFQQPQSSYNCAGGGMDSNAAASTGFSINATSGQTMTGGTIMVYGYRLG
jgi:hypothetical protein